MLYQTTGGNLILSVNCGTVAAYEIFLELTIEEASMYRKIGPEAIDALAKQVTSNPRYFGTRNVTVKDEVVVPAPLSWHD